MVESSSEIIDRSVDGAIITSAIDKRKYRYIQLKNEMKVMLVQDLETVKSAACLFVNSGNLNDPKEAQGIAHFCEHMLFLGTENYKEENAYSKFVSQNGGT
jgi:secreted Zn-dependent insulinase-like peptidase